MTTDSNTLYLRPVDPNVKAFFKAECAKLGVSMLDMHVEFMRQVKTAGPSLVQAIKLRRAKEKKRN